MALGPDNFNLTVSIDSIFCFQGDDIDDIFDEQSEPYLWTFMIKIDGEGLRQDGNFLGGSATFFFGPGSHGNIGGSILGGTRRIPSTVGVWNTSLRPIPISVAGQQLTTIPGTILCCAVLMEENLTPNSAIEAAHQSLIELVKTTVASTIASLGLAGLAADAITEVATAAQQGTNMTLTTAAQRVLQRRLKPIQDLFTVAAPANTAVTLLQNLELDGLIGTAIDADKPMGGFFQALGQAELARSFERAPGFPGGSSISLEARMWNMPEWAYTLRGKAYAHHAFVRNVPATGSRLQVTCSSKRSLMDGQKRVSGIGGLEDGNVWAISRAQAAEFIISGQKSFFVAARNGRIVEVEAVKGGYANGRPWFYLQTQSDQDRTNNLLTLPDCPQDTYTVEIWY